MTPAPGTGGGEGDEGSRKGEVAYAGGGGTGPLVALPSTLCELGGGRKIELYCRSDSQEGRCIHQLM